ncbi:MAG: restriction endonuclease subunit S [Proteocatella sp.]
MVDNTSALKLNFTQIIDEDEIIEDALKWCTVKLSEVIEKDKRFEASVFGLDGRYARDQLLNCKYELKNLIGDNGIATSYHRPRFKRVWVEKSKFPIYQPSSILDILPTPDGYVSEQTNTDLEQLIVKEGQILLTCSGTVGKTTVVTKTLANKIFSHDLIRIDCLNKEDIGFVYAYLKSKTGNTILQTNSYGSVITHIEPDHLSEVPIPYPSRVMREEINNLIMKSFELRDKSNEILGEASSLLIKALNLPPVEDLKIEKLTGEVDSYSVKLSEVNNRIDGSYHVPVVKAILAHLEKHSSELVPISDPRVSKRVFLPGRFKRVYVEEGNGRVFFGGKQIYELDPTNKKYLSVSKHDARIKKELEIIENMILVTRSGTIGKVVMTPKHWEKWIINEHVIRIEPSSPEIAGYLSVFLNTDYGYRLITRFTYGSVVDEINEHHVGQVRIPLLKDEELQNNISAMALEANNLRFEAYKLEQKALTAIDKIIFTK